MCHALPRLHESMFLPPCPAPSWPVEKLSAEAKKIDRLDERVELFKKHGNADDPNSLKCMFTNDEIRALYGRFKTARRRSEGATEAWNKAALLKSVTQRVTNIFAVRSSRFGARG